MYFKENIFSLFLPAITVTIFITTTPLVLTIIYGILVEYKHNMATPVLIHVASMSILCHGDSVRTRPNYLISILQNVTNFIFSILFNVFKAAVDQIL